MGGFFKKNGMGNIGKEVQHSDRTYIVAVRWKRVKIPSKMTHVINESFLKMDNGKQQVSGNNF